MATSKTLELSIKIAGRMDKSLTAAINGTQSKIGSLTKSMPATLGYTAHHALLTGGQPGAFAVSPEFTGTLPVPATVGYSVCGALRSGGVATGYTASPEFAGTLPEEAQHGN